MMRWQHWFGSFVLAGVAAVAVVSSGCTKNDPATAAKDKATSTGKEAKVDLKKDDHSGWWCQEHGIPEEICSLCSATAAAKFKKEGDWCQIHGDRAKSQCFKCDPELYKKYEALYVAKYNKKPEPPPREEFEK